MSYSPTPVDIEYAHKMMHELGDGGTLAFPEARLKYRVDRKARKMTLMNPGQLAIPFSQQIHARTKIVWAVIGYTVEEYQQGSVRVVARPNGMGTLKLTDVLDSTDDPRKVSHATCIECGREFDIRGGQDFPKCPFCDSGQSIGKRRMN